MLLSVIVPIYNAVKHLPKCLDSLSLAWRDEIEIILVDDGSIDSSGQICNDFQKQYSFVKVVHQRNSGSVTARKRGVKEASGMYITSVDADDWIESDYLEHMLSLIKRYEPDVVVTNFTSVSHKDTSVYRNPIATGLYQGDMMELIHSQMLCCGEKPFQFGINPTLWAKCFRKDVIVRMFDQAPTDVSMGDDAIITYPCLLNAKSIYMSDHAGYNYLMNEESMTHAYNVNLARQCVNLLKYLDEVAEEYKGNVPRQTRAYGRFIAKLVFINEFIKGNRGYGEAKANFMHFLNQGEVTTAMKMKDSFSMSLREQIFYRCLSWKIIFLPYLIVRIRYT